MTNVDGVYLKLNKGGGTKHINKIATVELKKMGKTCVDKVLPHLLERSKIDCWVLNGTKTDNLKLFLPINITVIIQLLFQPQCF